LNKFTRSVLQPFENQVKMRALVDWHYSIWGSDQIYGLRDEI